VLQLDVANPADVTRQARVPFLVDTGAIYSFVPPAPARRARHRTPNRERFRLADGSVIERDRGFFCTGRRGAAPVIFGEPGDATLLRVVTLGSLGLGLDAVRRHLLALPMVVTAAA
jgi:hypothetical protein